MLNDYERKVLRILYNYSGIRSRFPTMYELSIKTGRGKADIVDALEGLAAANYITWADKSDNANIVILEGWNVRVSNLSRLKLHSLTNQVM